MTRNQVARSPVEEYSHTPSAVHDPVPVLTDGFAPGTWASRPYAT
ncbi:hypothetical protein [Nocardioides aquiterrae]